MTTQQPHDRNSPAGPPARPMPVGAIIRLVLGILDLIVAAAFVVYRPDNKVAILAAVCLALLGVLYIIRGVHGLRHPGG
jgi:hypothetical protein